MKIFIFKEDKKEKVSGGMAYGIANFRLPNGSTVPYILNSNLSMVEVMLYLFDNFLDLQKKCNN